ncbi:DUF4405 domain-containing protein [Spirosoma endophyticum]|uniref:Uncharacterized protein n=1 Tax=Spirosoma endophyticum TaxID=662367 RepID=A0A1I1QWG3_9BACT|nr:DUF4405 domain-containing protein [Spirosoma endophyticum]SFD23613.1 protein of unknown function [Spirosoma endophyticum]
MKSKNLVSLFVAAIFFVLAITGLLIYFGQGSHIVDHTHAWFGILFVTAAVFHIVNNWSSLKGYTKNRRTGGIQKEVIIPTVVAAVFAAGIGFDIPVFDKLANAGKNLVRGEKPKDGPLSQARVDSIANVIEAAYATAYSKGDTAALAAILPAKTTILTEAGTLLHGSDIQQNLIKQVTKETIKTKVDNAEALDDHLIVVRGTSTTVGTTTPSVYTHLLKEQDKKWQIIAAQRAYPSVQ